MEHLKDFELTDDDAFLAEWCPDMQNALDNLDYRSSAACPRPNR